VPLDSRSRSIPPGPSSAPNLRSRPLPEQHQLHCPQREPKRKEGVVSGKSLSGHQLLPSYWDFLLNFLAILRLIELAASVEYCRLFIYCQATSVPLGQAVQQNVHGFGKLSSSSILPSYSPPLIIDPHIPPFLAKPRLHQSIKAWHSTLIRHHRIEVWF